MLDGSYKDWETFIERLGYFNDKNFLKQDGSYDLLDFSNLGGQIEQSRRGRGLSA
jgi:hypothetical protein